MEERASSRPSKTASVRSLSIRGAPSIKTGTYKDIWQRDTRKETHRRFKTALEQNSYEDAYQMLKGFEKWLRNINESAADSLLEAFEDILTLHRLKV